jgi:antitoxin component YwqK of YwqJK toxin-antitoxin module
MEGAQKHYYQNGQLKLEATYKDGKEDVFKEYYENGQIIDSGNQL